MNHRTGPRANQLNCGGAPAGPAENLVHINSASATELEKLPGIGPGFAARIVDFRERYGRFRRVEHLMMVRGIGERRFNRLCSQVTTE